MSEPKASRWDCARSVASMVSSAADALVSPVPVAIISMPSPRAAMASATITSIRVKPDCSARLFSNGYPPRQPVHADPPDAFTASQGNAAAGAAPVRKEANAPLRAGNDLILLREQRKPDIAGQCL